MKKTNTLLVASTLVLLALLSSCNGRKSGSFCNITFIGHNVSCDCPTYAPAGRDLELNLDILYQERAEAKWFKEPTKTEDGILDHPNVEYTVSIEDIHVNIGGKDSPDSFTFYYRNNGHNLLTIKKEYMTNDVDIEIVARPRPYLFLFGYELGEELDNRWYGSEVSEVPAEKRDLFVSFKSPYQQVRKPISTLSGQAAFPVFEHDDIDVTFEVDQRKIDLALAEHPEWEGSDDPETQAKWNALIESLALPYDLRYRCNARYTYENLDYTREYSEPFGTFKDENGDVRIAYKKCHFKVPHFIVNDHGSFRQFGTE